MQTKLLCVWGWAKPSGVCVCVHVISHQGYALLCWVLKEVFVNLQTHAFGLVIVLEWCNIIEEVKLTPCTRAAAERCWVFRKGHSLSVCCLSPSSVSASPHPPTPTHV